MASERSELILFFFSFFFGLIVQKYGVFKMELVDAKKVINVSTLWWHVAYKILLN